MADIIIANPTANLFLVGQKLISKGTKVEFVYTDELPITCPQKVYYFYDNQITCYSTETEQIVDKIDFVMSLKPSMMTKWSMLKFSSYLQGVNPKLAQGSVRDVAMLKSGCLKYRKHSKNYETFPTLKDVAKKFQLTKIIAGATAEPSREKICFWETDFEIDVTIGKDYFVMANEKTYVEVFNHNGQLVTISEDREHIDKISKIVPMFKKFKFKKIEERNITRNFNPWIKKSDIQNVQILNDYSYGLTSVSMPSPWYEKVATTIDVEKQKPNK